MEEKEILNCINQVIAAQNLLEIQTSKDKCYTVFPVELSMDKLIYTFETSGKSGSIFIRNIVSCISVDRGKKEKIEKLQSYFMEIVKCIDSDKKRPENEKSDFRENIFTSIFADFYKSRDNLLYQYFSGELENEEIVDNDPILLLQRSNLSQKAAIKAALERRVSIIEGPPGTGKTTTILSIIANMIVRGKRVVVVSKNNSAINNVAEEFQKMEIPHFYIRLGNREIMKQVAEKALDIKTQFESDLKDITEKIEEKNEIDFIKLVQYIDQKENRLNELIKLKNLLLELKNQLRHMEKLEETYVFSEKMGDKLEKRVKKKTSSERAIDQLAASLIRLENKENFYWRERIFAYFNWHISLAELREKGLFMQYMMERKYLVNEIERITNELNSENLGNLQKEVETLYNTKYNIASRKTLCKYLAENIKKFRFEKLDASIYQLEEQEKKQKVKGYFIDHFPLVLTTVDSVLANYYSYFNKKQKIDCLIIDEASQCDILSALPLLSIAEKMVVVGDTKQLSAIANLPENINCSGIPKQYSYNNNNFLSTVKEVFCPVSTMLLEHYRCDYRIINFCNKYFYDNQLIIYTEANNEAMQIVNADKGKYVERGKNDEGEDWSFINTRENLTVSEMLGGEIDQTFIITPFAANAKLLEGEYNKEQCGTIHTFQGKGEKTVYFTTVLNDTDESRRHVTNGWSLFTKELINVAVSRAKKKFILVTDKEFFRKYNTNMRYLIEYMEAYGQEIEDKTICLFDYLYRKMSSYTVTGSADNPFEETLQRHLRKWIINHKEYDMSMKIPLMDLVTDKKYLEANPDIYKYICNNAHTDYTIYDCRINKPVLVIELDGKHHQDDIQKRRDEMKDHALNDMGIEVWRISSKRALTEAVFEKELGEKLSRVTGNQSDAKEEAIGSSCTISTNIPI